MLDIPLGPSMNAITYLAAENTATFSLPCTARAVIHVLRVCLLQRRGRARKTVDFWDTKRIAS